jgi:peptidoglycan hydrolase-like protein with peptidoglycan-binding domain
MGSWCPDFPKNLWWGLITVIVVAVLQVPASVARAQDELAQRRQTQQAFSDLVVRVLPQRRDGLAAPAGQGFGIIVARRGQELIIATPRHVVFDDAHTDAPNVRFRTSPNTDVPAMRLERSSPQDDLAWLTVRAQTGAQLSSAPAVPAVPAVRLTNRWVWAIGHGEAWNMSPRGGTFEDEDPLTRLFVFGGLDVIPGSSGGAVVTADGVAGMILRTSGVGRVTALPVLRIQQLLPRFFDQIQSTSRPPNEIVEVAVPEQQRSNVAPSSPRALTNEEIILAQDMLAALGFNTGGADGIVGPRSRSAMAGFAQVSLRQEDDGFDTRNLARLEQTRMEFLRLTERGDASPRGVPASIVGGVDARFMRGWNAERANPPDFAEAAYWYGLAARQHDLRALNQLGLLAVRGQGVPQEAVGGSLLWRLAAARGDATAAFNLGAMLERGVGVNRNPRWARFYYDLASQQGHSGAREALQRMGQ